MSISFFVIVVLSAVIVFLIYYLFKVKSSEETQKLNLMSDSKADVDRLNETILNLKVRVAELETQNNSLQTNLNQRDIDIKQFKELLNSEFNNIANRVLIEKGEQIGVQNRRELEGVLKPLKEKINDFEKKVDDNYEKELRDKVSLREEIRHLSSLNQEISSDAKNLTNALRGNVKRLGNWGEMILERILEKSGLTKGREFRREETIETPEHSNLRPDVIVDLPDNKHIIIDSKLSIAAFERYVNSTDEKLKEQALSEHKKSIITHVDTLFQKNYSSAYDVNCPDFVLMFIPIEASFALAIESNNELFSYAWDRKIIIVSPTTLLATLRTIASIWKQENQTRNAQAIAEQSGALYDKFVGFLTDFDKIDANIATLKKTYDSAKTKLSEGKGNLISRSEKIRELGAKNNKTIPTKYN